jgi:hypothetical protein
MSNDFAKAWEGVEAAEDDEEPIVVGFPDWQKITAMDEETVKREIRRLGVEPQPRRVFHDEPLYIPEVDPKAVMPSGPAHSDEPEWEWNLEYLHHQLYSAQMSAWAEGLSTRELVHEFKERKIPITTWERRSWNRSQAIFALLCGIPHPAAAEEAKEKPASAKVKESTTTTKKRGRKNKGGTSAS